jgi:hypothetical protein
MHDPASFNARELIMSGGTMKRVHTLSAIVATFTAVPVMAQEQTSNVSIGVTAGTLGIGPEVTARITPLLALRGNATFLGFGHSVDGDDIRYDGDLKLASVGATVDVHPFRNGFRFSGGARYNKNKVRLTATPGAAESVNIGGSTYTGAQIGTLNGDVRVNRFAPTLTLGYASGRPKGFRFGIDAGVMFEGKPRIRDLRSSGPIATNASFQDALAREERDIRDDVAKYDIFPIVQLSLGYAF